MEHNCKGLWGRGYAVLAVPVFALCSHPEAHPICITATSVYWC